MDLHGTARRRAEMPRGMDDVLSARSLSKSHLTLDQILSPGMSVLDVGCGIGAITRGVAERVGPDGRAVGVDVNSRLIQQARETHQGVSNLTFETRDVYNLGFDSEFDVTTAARVLQWLSDPEAALRQMIQATVVGGRVIVLDYNHEKLEWTPDPPPSVKRFYTAFLEWRESAGMDNRIADHLTAMFARAGLGQVSVTVQLEGTVRNDDDFEQRIRIWESVIASRGHQMVADGVITDRERALAEMEYRNWVATSAESQTMYLLAVEGVR